MLEENKFHHFILTGNSRQKRKQLREIYRNFKYVKQHNIGSWLVINQFVAWN